MVAQDVAQAWLRVNGWVRIVPTGTFWSHPDHTRERRVSMTSAIELTMRADVERATVPGAR